MNRIERPARAREAVAAMDVVAGLTDPELDALLDELEWVEVPGGEALFHEGEASDSFYVIVRGRLRALLTDDAGEMVVIRELSRGDPVGELGLLTGAPRSATVVAVRDTELARFSQDVFERAVERTPRIALPLARLVANRMNDRRTGRAESGIGTVAILAASPRVDLDSFVDAVLARLPVGTETTVLHAASIPDASESALAEAIDRHEQPGGLVVLVGTAEAGTWDVACGRQADRVLVVADATHPPSLDHVLPVLSRLDRGDVSPSVDLVLVHRPTAPNPTGTARWLDQRPFVSHHHLRAGDAGDFERLGRHLTGRTVHLALGGGGARALSQIGAIRALQEQGIPIDRVGGSSMGGVMGLQLAFGWSPDEMQSRNRKEWGAAAIQRRFTVPMVSLLSVRTARPMFERMFGGAGVEDAWLPCFVTTVDLTTCQMVPQRRGSAAVWRARRRRHRASGRRSSIATATSSSTAACSTTCRSTRCGPDRPVPSSPSTSRHARRCRWTRRSARSRRRSTSCAALPVPARTPGSRASSASSTAPRSSRASPRVSVPPPAPIF